MKVSICQGRKFDAPNTKEHDLFKNLTIDLLEEMKKIKITWKLLYLCLQKKTKLSGEIVASLPKLIKLHKVIFKRTPELFCVECKTYVNMERLDKHFSTTEHFFKKREVLA